MFKLLYSIFRRIMTAVTSPFRMILVRIQRLFNINVITAKLITPLTKKVKSLITLKPQSPEDYYVIGKHWVYKKLFLTLILVLCAGVFIYFTTMAPKLPAKPAPTAVTTNISYSYDDMDLREFSGVANIKAADGKVVYTGEIASGICKGEGTLYDRSGRLVYKGSFSQNRYSGKGVSYYPSGKVKYDGTFADNLYSGAGILYNEDGQMIYTGNFASGLYSGDGKEYRASGKLLYEGSFSEGKHHGEGTLYYEDGTVHYQGGFFQGAMQGQGSLYSDDGKLLYTGDMHSNAINYRSLVHSTLADIEESFTETPRIFYTDTESAFVFEQAGVIVTTSSRVLVDTWKRPAAEVENEETYYLPEGANPAPNTLPPPTQTMAAEPSGDTLLFTPFRSGDQELVPAGGQGLQVVPLAWYVPDASGNIQYGEVPEPGASSEAPAPPSSSSAPPPPPGSDSQPPAPQIIIPPAPGPEETKPDFVEQQNTLYFEIDKNVWQSEAELDKSKVQIQKVTVFGDDEIRPILGAVEFKDDLPPSMEDCVAIDFLRQSKPTAFPQVMFEMDKQNWLFVRLHNVNFAAAIRSRAYLSDNLTYRYFYNADEEKPLFFSIER